MLRSAYMAQELLTTFTDQVKGVLLIPSDTGGAFIISINDQVVFNRKEMQRFPEIKELKKLVRDLVDPQMDLGHTDQK